MDVWYFEEVNDTYKKSISVRLVIPLHSSITVFFPNTGLKLNLNAFLLNKFLYLHAIKNT
jgi:hypothetical protein